MCCEHPESACGLENLLLAPFFVFEFEMPLPAGLKWLGGACRCWAGGFSTSASQPPDAGRHHFSAAGIPEADSFPAHCSSLARVSSSESSLYIGCFMRCRKGYSDTNKKKS